LAAVQPTSTMLRPTPTDGPCPPNLANRTTAAATPSRFSERIHANVTTSDALGANARQAMIDIFRMKDATAVDRYFGKPFIQHDPNLVDGFAGMQSYAAEIASSPAADITIFRTLVDGGSVLLHSRYEGLKDAPGPLIAMDLFRFKDGKIVEHWGGQEPELSDRNLSGHTQVDGPTAVEDREKTEANRAFIQTYRETITVQQHYDRIDEFLADDYTQHAPGFGDGIERVKARYRLDVKPGTSHVLTPRFYVADGNFVLSVVDAKTDPPKANYDLFRITNAKIAEHWEVLAPIPPRAQWKNSNDPFEREDRS
jgi:predicted SnoaL-like aldol condensation-catalyzing enzyme